MVMGSVLADEVQYSAVTPMNGRFTGLALSRMALAEFAPMPQKSFCLHVGMSIDE